MDTNLIELEVGHIVKGRVKTFVGQFVLVAIHDVICYLPNSEISWMNNPGHIQLAVGEEIEAAVVKIEDRKVMLSRKSVMADPWETVENKYQKDVLIKRPIKRVTNYGLFFELEPGVDGLLHINEFGLNRRINPELCFKKGQEVEFLIKGIDIIERKIELTRQAIQNRMWNDIKQSLHSGEVLDGIVMSVKKNVLNVFSNGVLCTIAADKTGLTEVTSFRGHYIPGQNVRIQLDDVNQEEKIIHAHII